jgi:tripartite-type tricarboxylate transporter receptor subunit TctC
VLDGKLNGLCVTTTERSASAPELPTMRECAPELARFEVSSWFGVIVPKPTPPEIVNALNLQAKAMLERDDIRRNIAAMGARPDYSTPEQYAAFIEAETTKFAGSSRRKGCRWR